MAAALLLAGVTALGAGMAAIAAGVVVSGLFLPGVFFVGVGLLLAAAAGMATVLEPTPDAGDEA